MTATTNRPPRRTGLLLVVAVLALIVGLFLAGFSPFERFFHNETVTATGRVALLRIRSLQDFVAAEGSFQVPVVVCQKRGSKADIRAFGRRDVDELLGFCTGFGDERATVLVEGTVQGTVDFGALKDSDIEVNGSKVTIRLPQPELEPSVVDAAKGGVTVIEKKTSFWPGGLPENYQSRAAEEGATAINGVADDTALQSRAEESTRTFLEGLLRGLGFTDVTIEFVRPPKG